MTVTRSARAVFRGVETAAIQKQKAEYRDKIVRIQSAFTPALSNFELSRGLELAAHDTGQSAIGRYVSTSPRLRRARPDTATRAMIDGILSGAVLVAVQRPAVPGARREVLVCDAQEAARLGVDWTLRNVSGGPVPERKASLQAVDWEDDDLWDLGASPSKKSAVSPRPAAGNLRFLWDLDVPGVGLGCMRLSSPGRPSRDAALAVLTAALDAGIRLLDTADTYAEDESDLHHNHGLIREALAAWSGTGHEVVVATKVGMLRRAARYIPCGRPEHILEAARRSASALGGPLTLLQLHAVDGSVPFDETLDAFAVLVDEGCAERIGLCNVKREHVEQALETLPVVSVQNACSVYASRDLETGFVAWLAERGIAYIAHSPLGGHRRHGKILADPTLGAVEGVEPAQAGLSWLLGMAPNMLVIPGATNVASVHSSAAAPASHGDLLDAGLPWASQQRARAHERFKPVPGPPRAVVIMGSPASGKTTRVAPLEARGFLRLNRDDRGGKLDDLLAPMEEAAAAGTQHFVLDNTYPTRKSRRGVIDVARRHDLPAHCVYVEIEEREALYNAALRIWQKQGRMLSPDEISSAGKQDPNILPPQAIYRFRSLLEPPTEEEGFGVVTHVPFVRRRQPQHTTRALILDYDGTLRRSLGGAPFPRSPDEVEILPGRAEKLAEMVADGWTLLGVSNQSGISRGDLTLETAEACFARTNELLGQDIPVLFCPHPSGAVKCWCRKPMPGLGVQLVETYGLDRAASLYVGDLETDAQFAANVGFGFQTADAFFGDNQPLAAKSARTAGG